MYKQTEITFKSLFNNKKKFATLRWDIEELYVKYKHSVNISNIHMFSPSKNDWKPLKRFKRKPIKGFVCILTHKHSNGIMFDCDRIIDIKRSIVDNNAEIHTITETYTLKDLYDELQANVIKEILSVSIPYMPTKEQIESNDLDSTAVFWEPIINLEYKDMSDTLEYAYDFEFEDDECLDFCLGPGNIILPL